MMRSRPIHRLGAAVGIGLATAVLFAGAVSAHPASEGPHPSGCIVTVEPGSVGVGGQFTVAGNFGGASIFLVRGAGAAPAPNAQPAATTPQGSSFSVTFIAEAGDVGEWTVVGVIPETECGDSDGLTVTAVPNTAMTNAGAGIGLAVGLIIVALGVGLGFGRLVDQRPRSIS